MSKTSLRSLCALALTHLCLAGLALALRLEEA